MTSHSAAPAGDETPEPLHAPDGLTGDHATDLPALDGPITRRGLSVVLPAYNEESVIAQTVGQCVAVLSVVAPDYEVIVVDDGSRDRTGAIADELAAANPRVRAVHNRPNRGYGGALMAGFGAASKSLTFFMDADGQFDIRNIAPLLREREAGHRVVLGYREHRRDPWPRLVNAWGWNVLVSLLFGLHVRDVDCAFKVYDTNLVHMLDVQAAGAMVNTEMLAKIARVGVPYVEVPVQHYPRQHGSATGAQVRVILHAFGELFHLRGKLHRWSATVPPEEPEPDTLPDTLPDA
ncbi:MAG TPA: glycosyltransferase family 2 protein [Ktedonobacterales bacterium]